MTRIYVYACSIALVAFWYSGVLREPDSSSCRTMTEPDSSSSLPVAHAAPLKQNWHIQATDFEMKDGVARFCAKDQMTYMNVRPSSGGGKEPVSTFVREFGNMFATGGKPTTILSAAGQHDYVVTLASIRFGESLSCKDKSSVSVTATFVYPPSKLQHQDVTPPRELNHYGENVQLFIDWGWSNIGNDLVAASL